MRGKVLTERVYEIIANNWPIHTTRVCEILNIEANSSNISKIKYHFDKLREQEKILTRKIDRALVAWPTEIEKLRVMHELIKS